MANKANHNQTAGKIIGREKNNDDFQFMKTSN
jgi:hypothetical protein